MAPGPVVLLDTNALFLPFSASIDVVDEVRRWDPAARLAVPSAVLDEVDRLRRRGVRHAALAAALASSLPSRPSPGSGDDAVAALALRLRAAVVTADRGLRDRLAAVGLTVLVPRQKSRLEPFHRRARAAMVKNRPPLARRLR